MLRVSVRGHRESTVTVRCFLFIFFVFGLFVFSVSERHRWAVEVELIFKSFRDNSPTRWSFPILTSCSCIDTITNKAAFVNIVQNQKYSSQILLNRVFNSTCYLFYIKNLWFIFWKLQLHNHYKKKALSCRINLNFLWNQSFCR